MSLLVLPAEAQKPVPVDGPYLFYQGDSIAVKTILQREDLSMPASHKYTGGALSVPVSVSPSWSFEVNLKKNITSPSCTYAKPEKAFILSDIEGEFSAGRQLLIASGVMDENYNWTFGKGHLIIAGDLFDRGTEVLPWLWLLYSLEDKAAAVGGNVHVVLGNHDIMQLSGDYRYTDAKYFKHAWLMGREIRTLFGEDTELGRWLRSKNVVEKIGDLLVLHAGVSPELIAHKWDLQTINDNCRPYYAVSRKNIPDSLQFLFDARSPFWYRGYFLDPKISDELVGETLKQYGCKQIVVGHTIADNISFSYGSKVIAVDVNQHEGNHQGLLITAAGEYYRIDEKGAKIKL